MLTQCPNCQTTFRVTAEILRVAEGQVRCGRCQTQFDALERLLEENDEGEIESEGVLRREESEPAPEPSDIEVDEPAAHEDITLEGRRIEISGAYQILDESGRGEPHLRQEVVEEWVEIDDADEADSQTAGESEGADAFESADATDPGESDFGESARFESARDRFDEPDSSERRESEPDFDLLALRQHRAAAPVWKWLAAPLGLLLGLQAVHHYRATLARHPRVGAPLVAVYNAFGLSLTPDWNLHAYEIRQWGVVSDPQTPGTLQVRASITNLADFAQPYPLLKLVLEDRWGDQVRARDFAPEDYLPPGSAAKRLLAPAQKANATIAIVDPGPDAEGFRFDVCLPGKRGTVCAGDVPNRPTG
jgi:predicted Zn finger-like uncharacterized protein